MILPSQNKAKGIIEILETLSKEGKMPSKRRKLSGDAQKWGARKTLYYLRDFVDADGPEFYQGELEQNDIIAQEALQNLINDDESLEGALEILLQYCQPLKEPNYIKNLENLKENPHFCPQTCLLKKSNLSKPTPTLWVWNKTSILFLPFEYAFQKNTKEVKEFTNQAQELSPHSEVRATILGDFTLSQEETIGFKLQEELWTHTPDSAALESPSWLLSHGMITEDILEIFDIIREEKTEIEIKIN
jgi:hypothetical protein